MARLTEQEIELIRRAKFAARVHTIDYQDVLAEAERLKAEMLARLLGQAAHWVARTTGLAVLGRSLSRNLFMPLRRATLRRRTVIGLQQLDNRLLSDIGLKREEIGYLATQLSQASVPSPVAERRVPGALKSRIRRWRTRRELEALGDDVLSDIGVRRSEIPTLVKQLQGQNDGPAAGAAIESAPSAGARFSAVMRDILGVLDSQIRRRRARRELEALSDHVLNDIGVRRSEIPALAKKLHGPVIDVADSAADRAAPFSSPQVLSGSSNGNVDLLADLGLASLPPAVAARLAKHAA
jgi:uncharacterized protein YjiS (DUF1127 family)